MRGLPIVIALGAAALILTPAPAATQVLVGAGHRTDQTPQDRADHNAPGPKVADKNALVPEVAAEQPSAQPDDVRPAQAEPPRRVRVAPPTGYTTDPPPKDDPRGVEERKDSDQGQ
jgi:hypothetical protein